MELIDIINIEDIAGGLPFWPRGAKKIANVFNSLRVGSVVGREEVQVFSLAVRKFQARPTNLMTVWQVLASKPVESELYLAETRSSCTVTLSGPPRSSANLTNFMQASARGRVRAA